MLAFPQNIVGLNKATVGSDSVCSEATDRLISSFYAVGFLFFLEVAPEQHAAAATWKTKVCLTAVLSLCPILEDSGWFIQV